MTLAIIYCGYNQAHYIPQSLKPWIYLRETCKEIKIKIYAVSVAFKEYCGMDIPVDNSKELLIQYRDAGLIDELIIGPDYVTEAKARDMALQTALVDGCTDIFFLDSDEFATIPEIHRLVKFVQNNELIPWFRGSLKNYVFDEHTYLTEPFTPPRWFRVKCGDFHLKEIYHDNDCLYLGKDGVISYNQLPYLTVPKVVAHFKHLTWLNDEKSKTKCEYQSRHFGICSYRWDNDLGLQFNEEYFKKMNLPLPSISRDTPH